MSKLCGGLYHLVCQAIASEKTKTKWTVALEKARFKEQIASLDA
jgi:hypothetical protein